MPDTLPSDLGSFAKGPDGALWFTEYDASKIGRITMAGAITEYPVPTSGSQPTGIVAGPDGALWFTEYGAGNIGRITTAGVFTEYALSAAYQLTGLVVGPDGALWFTSSEANWIGRITTAGVITKYAAPTTNDPFGLVAGPDGALWFNDAYAIGRITTAGVITEYPAPAHYSQSSGLVSGPDSALWFIESLTNAPYAIGRISTAGVITDYTIPSGNQPFGIVLGPDGALWFTEHYAGQIGRITTAGVVTEYPVPTSHSLPAGLVAGPDGGLWFTEALNNVGRITTAGAITEYPTPTSNCQTSSLVVGWDGAMWFTESVSSGFPTVYQNKIGRAMLTVGNGTINTSPAGLTFSVDGVSYTGAASFNWTVGESHWISVDPAPQPVGTGTRYVFTSWSDGGAQAHAITISNTSATYTAIFTEQYLLTTSVSPPGSGSVMIDPSVASSPDGYFNSGTTVRLLALPSQGFGFSNWSSALSGAATPQSVSMNAPIAVQANFTGPNRSFGLSSYATFRPDGIAVGPDGALWFSEAYTNAIGRITTAGVITQYSLPASVIPYTCIASGPDGALWFAAYDGGAAKIGRITTAGAFTEYSIPTNSSEPISIVAGPDGAMWFTETETQGKIGRITMAGVVTEFPLPTNDSASKMAAGPDGALWFTGGAGINRITTTGVVTQFPLPKYDEAYDIVLGPDGAMWFTVDSTVATNKIGRITMGGVITEYPVPTYGPPCCIVAGRDGAFWFLVTGGPMMERLTTAGGLTQFPTMTTAFSSPVAMVVGPDGALWFTTWAGGGNGFGAIGRFVPPTVNTPNLQQIAVFRAPASAGLGTFALDVNTDYIFEAGADKFRSFGLSGDVPVAGDFFGTGVVEIGVFRCPATGVGICQWYIDANNNGQWDGVAGGDVIWNFGLPGDQPIVGDWNGTGASKIGVMRCPPAGQPGVCTWYLDAGNKHAYDSATVVVSQFGLTGDIPVAGNWATNPTLALGDQIGVFRCPTPGVGVCTWIVDSNGSGTFAPNDLQFSYGLTGDWPIIGNWFGTGGKRIGVFRGGTIILNLSGSNSFSAADFFGSFGLPGDLPVAGLWTMP